MTIKQLLVSGQHARSLRRPTAAMFSLPVKTGKIAFLGRQPNHAVMQRELAGSFSMTLPTWFDLSPSGQIFQGRCIRRKRVRRRQHLRLRLVQHRRGSQGCV